MKMAFLTCSLVVLLVGVSRTQGTLSLQSFLSADPAVRMQGFYGLINSGSSYDDPTRLALINLLKTESAYIQALNQTPGNHENEDYAEYYSSLVAQVAAFRDVRSLSALIGLIDSGNIVTDALASFGAPAIDSVLAAAVGADSSASVGAMITFRKMLAPANFAKVNDPVSLNKIRVGLSTVANTAASPIARSLSSEVTTLLLSVYTPGDLTGDRKVDCLDVALVKASFGKKLGQTGFDARADVNLDGIVDVRDLAFVTQKLPALTRCP